MNIRKKIDEAGALIGLALLNAEAGLFMTIGTIANDTEATEIGWRILLNNKKIYSLMRRTHSPALNRKEWNENKEIQEKVAKIVVPPKKLPPFRKLHVVR